MISTAAEMLVLLMTSGNRIESDCRDKVLLSSLVSRLLLVAHGNMIRSLYPSCISCRSNSRPKGLEVHCYLSRPPSPVKGLYPEYPELKSLKYTLWLLSLGEPGGILSWEKSVMP